MKWLAPIVIAIAAVAMYLAARRASTHRDAARELAGTDNEAAIEGIIEKGTASSQERARHALEHLKAAKEEEDRINAHLDRMAKEDPSLAATAARWDAKRLQ